MRWLAIAEGVEPYIEHSAEAVAHAIANELDIGYHLIEVDPDTREPRLGEKLTVETAPLRPVRQYAATG